jgi:hypothetical protein
LAPWSLNCTGPSAVRRPGNPGSRGLSCAPIISQRPLKPTKAETVASRLMLCYPMLTNSCRVDCFGHASFVTVISRASLPMACVPCVSGKGNAIPRFLFLMFTGCKRDGHHSGEWDWVGQNLAAHNSTTTGNKVRTSIRMATLPNPEAAADPNPAWGLRPWPVSRLRSS